ncbi:MAG: hypothetical protein ABEJ83_01960 [Candidatus Nanohaloarchaea archaeon]
MNKDDFAEKALKILEENESGYAANLHHARKAARALGMEGDYDEFCEKLLNDINSSSENKMINRGQLDFVLHKLGKEL